MVPIVKTKINYKKNFLNHSKPLTAAILVISAVLALITLFAINNFKDNDFQAYSDFKIIDGVLEKYYGLNENVIIPNGVKEIGESAFEDCKTMTSITIPDSVKAIHEKAFYRTYLKKIHIPKSVNYIDKNSFECNDYVEIEVDSRNKKYSTKDGVLYNKDMTELIRYYDKKDIYFYKIPDSVEKIGDYALSERRVQKIYVPASINEIGDCAFSADFGISTIDVDAKNKYFIVKDNIMFTKDMTELVWYSDDNTADSYNIPEGVTTINAGAFRACRSLINLTIPYTVRTIEDKAFSGMVRMENLTIPEDVSGIGESVFFGCWNLKNVSVGEDNKYLTSRDGILFDKGMTEIIVCPSNNSIKHYEIPDGIKKVRSYAFFHCIELENVKIPQSVTQIGEGAFYDCARLASINLPEKIDAIAEATFWGCSNIVKIVIPDKVTYIDDKAFAECSSLEVELPLSLKYIGKKAFLDCGNLEKINFSKNVINVADDAFDGVSSLKSINVNARNKKYSSIDGVLFNKEMTKLIKYPGGKTNSHYAVPESVKTILSNAFTYCKDLTSLDVPASVELISDYAINSNDSNITSINVDGNNKYYSSQDGVLFDKAKKKLILYPYYKKEKEYEIPKGVETIKKNAFINCYYLQQLTIPTSVIAIEELVFNRNEQFCIKGKEFSVAHECAVKNNIPFIPIDE